MQLKLNIPMQVRDTSTDWSGFDIDYDFMVMIKKRADAKTGPREPGDDIDYIQNILLALDEYLWWKEYV